MGLFEWRHDTQHNDIWQNTQYNITLSVFMLCQYAKYLNLVNSAQYGYHHPNLTQPNLK